MLKNKTGLISLLGAAVIYASFGIWMRILGKEMSAYQATALANFFAAIFALIIISKRKKRIIVGGNFRKLNLAAFVIVVPASIIFYNFSLLNTKIATASFSFYAGTLITAFFVGRLFFREKITIIKLISFALAIIGLSFLSFPFSFNFGFITGLFSGLFDGLANSFKKDLGGKLERMTLVLISRVASVLVAILMILISGEDLLFFTKGLSWQIWLTALVFGLLYMGVIYLTIVGFQRSEVSIGTIILSTELFFTPIIGLLVFKEMPLLTELIGGTIIFMAMVIPNLKFTKHPEAIGTV